MLASLWSAITTWNRRFVGMASGSNDQPQRQPLRDSWVGRVKERSEYICKQTQLGLGVSEEEQINTPNGLKLKICGIDGVKTLVVPEEIMVNLLSGCPVEDILKINQVCRQWKTMTTKLSFWKMVFQNNGLDFNRIPKNLWKKENAWIALEAIARYRLFDRNLIRNCSGENDFNHWTIVVSGGDGLRVEPVPAGCDRLPEDGSWPNSCFVTSYTWGQIDQKIKLSDFGLNRAVLKLISPFNLKLSVMAGTRFDCNAKSNITLEAKQRGFGVRAFRRAGTKSQAGAGWKMLEIVLPLDETLMNDPAVQIDNVVVKIGGSDSQFWAGHYGTKFARIKVTIELRDNEHAPPSEDALRRYIDNGYEIEVEPFQIITEQRGSDMDTASDSD